MKDKTVHVVGGFSSYRQMFLNHGWWLVDDVEDADLVQFCGGPDVSPILYGEKAHKTTRIDVARDEYERKIYELAKKLNKPCAGICRGAQFLHVMNGGSLWQDVDGHATDTWHCVSSISNMELMREYGDGFYVNSTHHQQMKDDVGEVLLAAYISQAKHNEGGLVDDGAAYDWDVEAVWHEVTKCFCYQPHPELANRSTPCQTFYFRAIKHLIFPKNEMKEAV